MRHPALIPLSHDHHHALALALRCRKQALGHLKPMGAAGLAERQKELREYFAMNLVNHFRAEEEALFPALRRIAGEESKPLLDQLLREHEEIRSAVANLEGAVDLAKLIFDVGDLLERHVRKEERELFPLFERHVDLLGADRIGARIKEILAGSPANQDKPPH